MGSSLNFVIAAYALTWVSLIAYTLHTHRALRRARDEYQRSSSRSVGGRS